MLKGFLDFALAAFPGIRDRLKAKIDKYVAVAEKFVNETFEVFKKAVVAIIDFLAEAVDTMLGALQNVYNFVLDAVNTIVSGIIKMLEFILDIEKQYNLFKKLITGIQEIWNNPKILENYVIGFIAPFIDKIPGEANSQFKKFFAQSGVSFAKHIRGVLTHLQPILAYMAGNWWGEMKKMIWYLVWPFAEGGPVRTEAPKLWTLIPEIWKNISNNNFSKAVDGGLAWMQTLNTVVGTFSGWITIGSVLIGGIVGAFFGGVGAIPGIMAGLEFATAVGEGLLLSMLATESGSISKAVFDILTTEDDGIEGEAIKKKREIEKNESGQDGEQSEDNNSIVNYESNDVETGHDRLQYAYQRIANSGFALAIIAVFLALGALATNIVKALKPKFSPRFANFKAKVKNTKAGKVFSKGKANFIEKGRQDYRPEWIKSRDEKYDMKMATGSEIGVIASEYSIRVGTVKMEDHPNFMNLIEEIKSYGFEIRYRDGSPHAAIHEIYSNNGSTLLRTEKFINVYEGMRYLDLEHEVGHMKQLVDRLEGLPTEKFMERENGTIKNISQSKGDVLTSWQDAVTEFHNRLDEYIKLKNNGANEELLKKHADGITHARKEYRKALDLDKNPKFASKNKILWKDTYFSDISSLEQQYIKVGGINLEEQNFNFKY